MSRLLYAGFVRAGKDPLVRMGMALMFLMGLFLVGIAYYTGMRNHEPMYLEEILYIYLPVIGFMSAVFCGYLSGQEYYDGTIRNKLIAGHTRVEIYLSNFIVNVGVVLCFWLITFLTEIALGLLLLDGMQADGSKIFSIFLGSLLPIIALCAIFTLIAMTSQNHSASDAVCILTACILLCVALYLMSVMSELKEYDAMVEEMGEVFVYEDEAIYPVIQHRDTYEFLYDFFPSAQIAQYVSGDVKHPRRLPLCSVGIVLVTMSFGILVFRKKNIR